MKLLSVLLTWVCLAVAQDEPKNILITTANGAEVRMRAKEILREPNLIHLKGDVEISTWWVGQPDYRRVVLHADDAVYHVDSGEVEAQGSVSMQTVKEK